MITLAQARAIRAAEAERWNRQLAQFQTWRPTPTREESNRAADGDPVLVKEWDLSEIDNLSFDPTEPPGRPDDGRPVLAQPPVIAGLARVGDPLTASTGTWTNAPTGFTYQWWRGGYDIAGATEAVYIPTVIDLHWPIAVRVTASNAVGPAAARSAFSAPVLPAAPTCFIVPVVSGAPEIGQQLTAGVGGWSGAATSYVFEWRRDLSVIDDEIGPLYTVTVEDEGFTLRAGVRGVNAGGPGSIAYSTAIGPVGGAAAPGAPPVNTVLPVVTGQTAVGATLTSSVGAWQNAPTAYARQWRRDAVDIPGATGVTYVLVPADLGAMISVQVVASNTLGSATAISLPVGPVEDAPVEGVPPANATPPSISGMRQVGQTLTVDEGTWTGLPTAFEYQWRRGAEDVAGATAATYLLAGLDQNWSVYCEVRAINASGVSAPARSQMLGPIIGAGLPFCTTLPVISGDAESGQTLTTTDGVWINAPTEFAYTWTRNGLLISEYEATFVLTDAEITTQIASRVTARNAAGASSFDSLPVGPVMPAGLPRKGLA
jgi:hypothetical protein